MSKTIKVAFAQYARPAAYPPTMNAASILCEHGVEVQLWGIGAMGEANKLRVVLRPGMSQHLLKYSPPGIRQKAHYIWFVISCVARTVFWRPSYVYVSDIWAYPIGVIVSLFPSVKVIAHEHDSAPESGTTFRILQWFRRKLFRRALMTVIPQCDRAELVESKIGPRRVKVVWNCPRLEEMIPFQGAERKAIRVLWYHGSIGPTQLPASVVRALPLLPNNVELRFAGYETISTRGYIAQLNKLAHELGVGDRCTYIGARPTRNDLFLSAAQADIGLALFARSFREPMVGASNKPFDYLACGLAILTNDTDEWKHFFEECPCAVACHPNSHESIAKAVMNMISDPKQFSESRRQGNSMMREVWNYECQFAEILHEVCGNQGRILC